MVNYALVSSAVLLLLSLFQILAVIVYSRG